MNDNYKNYYEKVKKNWDSVSKPLDSLGKLEEVTCKIGAIQQTEHPKVAKSAVLVLCADNGVVEEGISQSPQSVTRICAENIAAGQTTVGIMAKQTNTDVLAVNLGIAEPVKKAGFCQGELMNLSLGPGTRNFAKEPAMTVDECKKAIFCGKELARKCKEEGYQILCIGEMGIGNTTTSAAIATAMFHCSASEVTGRGAGLDDAKLVHKAQVIQQAVEKYDLYHKEPLEILQTVGGFDIAGMVGVYLGAKEYGIPLVLDGAISLVAALLAEAMEPGTKDYLIPSHKSREPLVEKVLSALDLEPILDAGMALGEGTGAVLMMGVLKTAVAVYEESIPFGDSGVEQYVRY